MALLRKPEAAALILRPQRSRPFSLDSEERPQKRHALSGASEHVSVNTLTCLLGDSGSWMMGWDRIHYTVSPRTLKTNTGPARRTVLSGTNEPVLYTWPMAAVTAQAQRARKGPSAATYLKA